MLLRKACPKVVIFRKVPSVEGNKYFEEDLVNFETSLSLAGTPLGETDF